MKTSPRIVLCSALFLSLLGCTKAESEAKPQVTEPPVVPAEPAPLSPEPVPVAPEPQAPPPSNTQFVDASTPLATAQPEGACSFVDPQFFGMLPAKWDGPCQDGKAHGRGILRSYDGKKVAATFYGIVMRDSARVTQDLAVREFGSHRDRYQRPQRTTDSRRSGARAGAPGAARARRTHGDVLERRRSDPVVTIASARGRGECRKLIGQNFVP